MPTEGLAQTPSPGARGRDGIPCTLTIDVMEAATPGGGDLCGSGLWGASYWGWGWC